MPKPNLTDQRRTVSKYIDAARRQQLLDHCKEPALRSRPLLCPRGAAPLSRGLLLSHMNSPTAKRLVTL